MYPETLEVTSEKQRAAALRVENISLAFEDKVALCDVSFEANYGETCVILGVTGAGKSLLLKLIVGLIKPDAGRIYVEGQEITRLDEEHLNPLRRRIGILFQEGALFDSLSVLDNVSFRLQEEKELNEEDAERRVREVLRFVEMEEAIDKFPSQLSGGMKRRVALARAMIDHPPIMLYDSPTGGLDPVTAQTIISLIVKLRDVNRVCSLLVTHRLQDGVVLANFVYDSERGRLVSASRNGEKQRVQTRFLLLRNGSVYFFGSDRELLESPDPYLRNFLV